MVQISWLPHLYRPNPSSLTNIENTITCLVQALVWRELCFSASKIPVPFMVRYEWDPRSCFPRRGQFWPSEA